MGDGLEPDQPPPLEPLRDCEKPARPPYRPPLLRAQTSAVRASTKNRLRAAAKRAPQCWRQRRPLKSPLGSGLMDLRLSPPLRKIKPKCRRAARVGSVPFTGDPADPRQLLGVNGQLLLTGVAHPVEPKSSLATEGVDVDALTRWLEGGKLVQPLCE